MKLIYQSILYFSANKNENDRMNTDKKCDEDFK